MAGFERIAPVGSRRRAVLRRLALKGPAYDQVTPRWNRWAKRHPDVFFVQIGSNDGFTGLDPLQAHIDSHTGWRGIMVEPIPETYARLCGRRTDPRFRLVQAALTDHDGTVTMNVFDDDEVDCTVLATIEPQVASGYTQFRSTSVEVPALTFASLTKDVDDIDVLHIDTEGHDAKILAQVDFDAWTMSAVLFEHHHLEPDARRLTTERLEKHGYRLWRNGWDTLGLR